MDLRRRSFTGTDAGELQSMERVVMQEHGALKEHRSSRETPNAGGF